VRRTPNQTASDMTFSRSCDQGKSQKGTERWLWTLNWFFEPNFKIVLFQLAWFSWLFDVLLVSRFVFMWQPWVCANTAAHLCLQYSSFVIYWQFRRIDHNRSHQPVSSAVARQPRTPGRGGRPFVGAPQCILYWQVRTISLPLTFTLLVFALNAEPVD